MEATKWLKPPVKCVANWRQRECAGRNVSERRASPGRRPLGISTLRDRVCMSAAMLVLEPIFEADLPEEMVAYRPRRNAQQAVVDVEERMFRGHPDIVDADLSDYFGSIPHAELLQSLARRIVDRRVLRLLKLWLEKNRQQGPQDADHRGQG